ncbi:MAG TPA: hypothetical protein VLM79_37980 [Kofleriaceae bacterium]|nr:hypothetical protein [Kofleriaceae bacterium]
MLRTQVLVGFVVAAGAARAAHADPATAKRLAGEADGLARAKDYLGAAAKFREAYAADPRPDLICNVGVAYHKAQELPRAQLYLSRCLERGSALEGSFIDVVRATMSRLEASLKAGKFTPVDVVVEPRFASVAVDAFAADETFEGGRTVWLGFGTYHVTVRADGYTPKTVEVVAKERAVLPLRIALERRSREVQDDQRERKALERQVVAPPTRELEPVGGSTTGPVAGPTPEPERPAPAPRRPSLVLPIATAVGAVAVASLAVVARLKAGDHADHARFALDGDSYESEADATRQWNTLFGVGLAVAGASALASGYFWYRVATAPSARVEVSQHGASITVAGHF